MCYVFYHNSYVGLICVIQDGVAARWTGTSAGPPAAQRLTVAQHCHTESCPTSILLHCHPSGYLIEIVNCVFPKLYPPDYTHYWLPESNARGSETRIMWKYCYCCHDVNFCNVGFAGVEWTRRCPVCVQVFTFDTRVIWKLCFLFKYIFTQVHFCAAFSCHLCILYPVKRRCSHYPTTLGNPVKLSLLCLHRGMWILLFRPLHDQ